MFGEFENKLLLDLIVFRIGLLFNNYLFSPGSKSYAALYATAAGRKDDLEGTNYRKPLPIIELYKCTIPVRPSVLTFIAHSYLEQMDPVPPRGPHAVCTRVNTNRWRIQMGVGVAALDLFNASRDMRSSMLSVRAKQVPLLRGYDASGRK